MTVITNDIPSSNVVKVMLLEKGPSETVVADKLYLYSVYGERFVMLMLVLVAE